MNVKDIFTIDMARLFQHVGYKEANQALINFVGDEALSLMKMAEEGKRDGARISSAKRGVDGWRINIKQHRHMTRLPLMPDGLAAALIGVFGAPKRRVKR